MKRFLLLLMIMQLAGFFLCVYAEAETEKTIEEPEIAKYILAADPRASGAPLSVRPDVAEAQHVKLFRFSQNVVLKGVFARYGFFFKISNYWETKYALAQLEYTVSPLIQDIPASMTFYINDQPIYSCQISYANGAPQIVFVLIPVEMLKEGFNEFAITGYVQMDDEEGCLDDFSGANWISISASSFLEAGYDLIDIQNRLCYYPYPLISTMDEDGSGLTVYVPENATEEELRAAFLLRADLGDETDESDRIALKTLRYFGLESGRSLIVARADRLPQEVRARLSHYADTAEEGAYVFEYGGNEQCVLVVTAKDDAYLIEGACMLADEDRVPQEKLDSAFVPAGSAEWMVINRSLSALIEDGETIKGITNQDGISFIGPFHRTSTIYLPFSGGFVLGEGGKVELRMRYSDNLDFDRSLVTVYWNSIPVASKKLTREKAGGDTFSFMMPPDVVGTHASSIEIAFDLEIREEYCTKRTDEMPWAYVSGDSTLYLPVGNSSVYDLSLRPYPFQRLGQFNNLDVVVPDQMTDVEYALFGRIAALLGSNITPYGSLRVWYASNFRAEKENCHVVTLGTYGDNSLIRLLNDSLSFKYADGGDRFANNEQLLLSATYAKEIGVIQLIRSPYQEGRGILAFTAPNDEALETIDRYCAVQENNWALAGDVFLIDKDMETKSFRFMEEQQVNQPSLRERLEEHRDAVILTLISTSAMFALLVSAVIILLRYRRNLREEQKK